MTRTTTLALACALIACAASAAVPPLISFQGKLANETGVASSDAVDITFCLYDLENAATPLWTEIQSVQPSDTGTFAVLLGSLTPLDAADFTQPLWLGVKVGLDDEMTPRFQLASAPYALRSASAEDADHAALADTATQAAHSDTTDALGSITETDIADLQTAVAGKADAAELTDGDNTTTPVDWADLANRPTGLDDGDDDTQLTATEVRDHVAGSAIDLAAGSTIGGATLAPASELSDDDNATTPVNWADLANVPAELANGDDDTQLTDVQVRTYVTAVPIDLAAGSTIGTAALAPASELSDDDDTTTPVNWADLANRPTGLDDGDDDTQLTDAQVRTYATAVPIDLAAGSMIGSVTLAPAGELSDNDNTTTPVNWADLANVPTELENGDDDTQLTDVQVRTYVTAVPIDLAAGSTIGTATLAPASELSDDDDTTTPVNWADIANRPAGLDNGDDNTQLTDVQVRGFVTAVPINLAAGSTIGTATLAPASELSDDDDTTTPVNWADIANVPSGLDNGDDNTQLTDVQVRGFVTGTAIDLAAGSTIGTMALAPASELSDDDDTTTPVNWADLANVPPGLDNGDDNTQLTDVQVRGFVTAVPIDLAAGSMIGTMALAPASELSDDDDTTTPVNWADLANVPAGLDNGDDNTQLSDVQVRGYVTATAIALAPGSSVGALIVELDGDVGIGEPTPTYDLDVAGSLRCDGLRVEPNATSPLVIGGHDNNVVVTGVVGGTIGGGGAAGNINHVTDDYGTVCGGRNNRAGNNDGTTNNAVYATIGGGQQNTASATNATVGGGTQNTAGAQVATVSGGLSNTASNQSATVAGGVDNVAGGLASFVGGGSHNDAMGDYSFAAGFRAFANATGTFVWSDNSSTTHFEVTTPNMFAVRAAGGVQMYSESTMNLGVELVPGGNSWGSLSDRNAKKDFTPIDGDEILGKIAEMPVTSWRYKCQDSDDTPLMGPVAQDLIRLFYPGDRDTLITTQQADGVHFAAIKALEERTRELKARNENLEKQLAELRALVESMRDAQ